MKIVIETIPHAKQRYPTVGDWYYQRDPFSLEDVLHVKVSASGDWRSDALVALHELVEVLLCRNAGVTQEAVDAFDMAWKGEGEPGDDPEAPYRAQHKVAMRIEHILCDALDMQWSEHEERIDAIESKLPSVST